MQREQKSIFENQLTTHWNGSNINFIAQKGSLVSDTDCDFAVQLTN